jgi:cytoskeletal protein CcmA (bactofilin family)
MRFTKQPEKDEKMESTATLSAMIQSASEPAPAPDPVKSNNGRARQEDHAFLDRGSKITGKSSFEGPVRIDGQVDGEITGKDSITISDSATVTAHIRAASVVIAGKVTGDIVASERIEIRPSANVRGNLTSPALMVHEGAVFDGKCSMRSDATREERKVADSSKEQRSVQDAATQKPNAAVPTRQVAS